MNIRYRLKKDQTVFSFLFMLGGLMICQSCTRPAATPVPPVEKLSILSIKPTQGNIQVYDTITGTGFNNIVISDSVYFNGVPASILSVSSTQIIVQVPKLATTGNVSVSVNGVIVQGPVFTINSSVVNAPLTITSISPTHGVENSMDTIFGSGFSPIATNNTVYFYYVSATVVSATSNRLIVTVPKSQTGNTNVGVNGVFVTGPTFTYDTTSTDSAIVTTIAGSGMPGHQDGIGTAASFSFLWDVAADKNGNVFVADGGNNLIRKILPDGTVTTVAGKGSQPAAYGPGTYFYLPEGVAVDDRGYIYVANTDAGDIYEITDTTPTLFAGTGGVGANNGPALAALFYQPTGIAVDNNYNIYIADYGNNVIRKISYDGITTTLAGGEFGNDDGVGTAASFREPRGVAVDGNGNVYVADMGNTEIRKVTPDGTVTTLAGNIANGGDIDGTGAESRLGWTYGVAVDANGNVYFSDNTDNKIKRISPAGMVTTIAGTGAAGSQDGPGKKATFNGPMGISVDVNGNVYVADGNNYKVRKITIVH